MELLCRVVLHRLGVRMPAPQGGKNGVVRRMVESPGIEFKRDVTGVGPQSED
jgi:hypothetical protein